MTRWRTATVLVLAVSSLAACTGPSTDPVSTTAATPYVCSGVPRAGTELLLGGSATLDRTRGAWGDDGVGFNCAVKHDDAALLVNEEPSSSGGSWGVDDATVLATLAQQANAAVIDADAPGQGYVFGPSAAWVCDGRFLRVESVDVDVDGRDVSTDVSRLLVSMLPWACGGAGAPEAS
jgi:hypothetical protein